MGSRSADVSTRDTATPLAACTRPCLVPLGLVLAVGGGVTQHSSQQQVESLLVRQAQGRPRAFTGPNPLACSAVATPRPLVGARNYPHVTAHSQLPHATSHTWSSTTAPDAMQEADCGAVHAARERGARDVRRGRSAGLFAGLLLVLDLRTQTSGSFGYGCAVWPVDVRQWRVQRVRCTVRCTSGLPHADKKAGGVQWARGAARCGAARCPPCSRCRRPPLYSAFARPAVVLAYAKHARP